MTSGIAFRNIDPELYRHPGEREALGRLEKIPGFAKALEMMSEGSGGKAERQAEIASMVRVGHGVYPDLATLWSDTLAKFGLGDIPLHIGFIQPETWAIRGGNNDPVLILSPALLEHLPAPEMAALLAEAAGTVRLANATTMAASDFLRRVSDFSGIAGAPAAMLAWSIENWRRHAAFSADRAAALSLGSPDAVTALLARVAGGGSSAWGGVQNPERLRIQALEARSLDQDWANNRWRRFAMAMNRHNTSALLRRLDLMEWFDSGVPARILSGELAHPEPAAGTKPPAPEAAVDGERPAADEPAADPGFAFWGEFAAPGAYPTDLCGNGQCPMAQLMGWAGKGLGTFKKAGEAFFKTMQDTMRDEMRRDGK